jgi:hypothetical protein
LIEVNAGQRGVAVIFAGGMKMKYPSETTTDHPFLGALLIFALIGVSAWIVGVGSVRTPASTTSTTSEAIAAKEAAKEAEQKRAEEKLALTTPKTRADVLDDQLRKDRGTMVAAVAVMGFVPDMCFGGKPRPTAAELARFVTRYGHTPDDAFGKDVLAHARKTLLDNDKFREFSEHEQTEMAKAICLWANVMSMKVREGN